MTHAPDVHGRDRRDHPDRRERVGDGREGEELTQIVCERHGERCRRAGIDREEQGPAEQERGQAAECFAHVDVAAPRVGEHGPQLTERDRPEQREHAPDHPHHQRHADVAA